MGWCGRAVGEWQPEERWGSGETLLQWDPPLRIIDFFFFNFTYNLKTNQIIIDLLL